MVAWIVSRDLFAKIPPFPNCLWSHFLELITNRSLFFNLSIVVSHYVIIFVTLLWRFFCFFSDGLFLLHRWGGKPRGGVSRL